MTARFSLIVCQPRWAGGGNGVPTATAFFADDSIKWRNVEWQQCHEPAP
jgi:hypothetical protein